MKIWLDDERPAPYGWIRVKTANEAIAILKQGGVTDLSLDHDLGPTEAGTGYDVVTWIEYAAAVYSFQPPANIEIHSANPVGRARITQVIDSIKRLCNKE